MHDVRFLTTYSYIHRPHESQDYVRDFAMYLTHSEIQQLELLKRKSPSDRFLLMSQLINDQFEVMKAGLKYKNPNLDEKELEQCLKARMRKIYSLKL
jgi:hypothetical protein